MQKTNKHKRYTKTQRHPIYQLAKQFNNWLTKQMSQHEQTHHDLLFYHRIIELKCFICLWRKKRKHSPELLLILTILYAYFHLDCWQFTFTFLAFGRHPIQSGLQFISFYTQPSVQYNTLITMLPLPILTRPNT